MCFQAKRSTDIYRKGVIEHYLNRPEKLKNICLAEFAGFYDYLSNDAYKYKNQANPLTRFDEDDEEFDEDDDFEDDEDDDFEDEEEEEEEEKPKKKRKGE
jgi:hypothetical protein